MSAQESSRPVIRVTGFTKRYKNHVAVQDVDLTVRRGELHGLIGPDGSGKSSLMKALAGVLSYEAGSVEVFGITVDSEKAAEHIKPRLGFMPQGLGLNLYPELSVEENIDFFARLRLVPEAMLAASKDRLLAMTRLGPFRDRAMKHLSGGMKQKLGLICTLIHNPELLILDEPTMGIDPVSRMDFWVILTELIQEQGLTAVVSTAYMEEAARFHRLLMMFEGRTLAAGAPDEIRAQAPGARVVLEADPQVEALARLTQGFRDVTAVGAELRVFVDEPDVRLAAQRVRDLLEGCRIVRLEAHTPELEDVFVALLRRTVPAGEREAAQAAEPCHEIPPDAARRSPARQGQSGIVARGLVRDFGRFRAVDSVSFEVRRGEIFGLLGANGAGKTTVIKMLTGILRPTVGEGWIAGAPMRGAGSAVKNLIGYMSQSFSLYADLTVVENIRLFAGIYGLGQRESAERLDWIIEMAGLTKYESDLTGRIPVGVRQRLALGCALIHRPAVLFLDEPTSGVDPLGRRRFWDILLRLAREDGVAILVTTHYMTEAEHCDRLALMYAGRIVADASPTDMKREVEAEAGRLLEVDVAEPEKAYRLLAGSGVAGLTLFGTRLRLLSLHPEQDIGRIRHILGGSGLAVNAISPRAIALEDVFVHKVKTLEQEERVA